jgi:splicing factor 3A subunit 1
VYIPQGRISPCPAHLISPPPIQVAEFSGESLEAAAPAKDATVAAPDTSRLIPPPPVLAAPAPPKPGQAPVVAPIKPLEAPEEEQYTIHIPEGLTLMDVDLMKLTAQFVARNGKTFLTGLASREHANPQFGFLKPTHSLFSIFTSLCDAYSRVLMPPKRTLRQLEADAADRATALERALRRLEWDRVREREATEAASAEEAERAAVQAIDWHDFVVVETIDFAEEDVAGLPAPVTLKDVLKISRAKREAEPQAEAPAAMDVEEQAMIAQGADATGASAVAPAEEESIADVDMDMSDEEEAPVKVVKNYVRQDPRVRAATAAATGFVVSPFTGELIPVDQMAEHMRVSLIDPRWREQKDTMLAKIKETTKGEGIRNEKRRI